MEVEVGDIVEVMGKVGRVVALEDLQVTIESSDGEIVKLPKWHYSIENATVLERGLDKQESKGKEVKKRTVVLTALEEWDEELTLIIKPGVTTRETVEADTKTLYDAVSASLPMGVALGLYEALKENSDEVDEILAIKALMKLFKSVTGDDDESEEE